MKTFSRLSNLVLTLCLFSSLSAQTQSAVFNFGLKAGINQPFFHTSFSSPQEYTTDDNFIYAGITTELRLSKHFGVQADIAWQKDPVIYYNNNNASVVSEELQYITLPVMAKLHIGKVSLYAGPQLSVLTKAEMPNLVNYGTGQRFTIDATDSSYKKIKFSFVGGIEWAFKYRFGLDLRYTAGLGNAANPNGITPLTDSPTARVVISNIQGGFFFRFGKKYKSVQKAP